MSAPVQRSKSRPKQQARDRLLSRILQASDGRALLSALRVGGGRRLTEVDAVTPPGSFLATVIDEVRRKTDLPEEIALGVVLSQMTASLAQAGCTVTWPGDSRAIEMSLWLVVLAPSGAGKTFLRTLVQEALGLDLTLLPEPGSGRAFLTGLQACEGVELWVRDEYGQLVRQISDGGPLATLRDYLLRAYDHAPLELSTQKDGLTRIDRPVLSIFATTVDTTWASCIDPAMLADGLLARHLFIVAQRRPLEVPLYPFRSMAEAIGKAAEGLRGRLSERVDFVIGEEAAAVYEAQWKRAAEQMSNVDPAYFRRVTWNAARYSVVYHLLLGHAGREIGAEAMQWAWRLVLLHLQYVREVLSLSDSGFASRLDKVLGWVEMRVQQGADPTSNGFVRELCRHFGRDLGGASEARQLIDFARKSAKSK